MTVRFGQLILPAELHKLAESDRKLRLQRATALVMERIGGLLGAKASRSPDRELRGRGLRTRGLLSLNPRIQAEAGCLSQPGRELDALDV